MLQEYSLHFTSHVAYIVQFPASTVLLVLIKVVLTILARVVVTRSSLLLVGNIYVSISLDLFSFLN